MEEKAKPEQQSPFAVEPIGHLAVPVIRLTVLNRYLAAPVIENKFYMSHLNIQYHG